LQLVLGWPELVGLSYTFQINHLNYLWTSQRLSTAAVQSSIVKPRASAIILGISTYSIFPRSLRLDFRFHFKNPEVVQKLGCRPFLLNYLFFYLSSLHCYLTGPGDSLLNLLFLALHSIVLYLLLGWRLAFRCPS
jgi:hypothetical protein